MGICDGRAVIVTGAARGLGRAHALAFAAEGARVVVNDLGVALDGTEPRSDAAEEVVAEIRAAGGEAVANADDIADFSGAGRLVGTALEAFGALDVVVNNAGFVRDRMFANAAEDEWDAVVRVHLKGHFATSRHAAAHWRDRAKAGEAVDARIVNTSSGAGLLGSVGQAAYSAAKAGIAALTLVQAAELGRYGVTANAIAPSARTPSTAPPRPLLDASLTRLWRGERRTSKGTMVPWPSPRSSTKSRSTSAGVTGARARWPSAARPMSPRADPTAATGATAGT